MKATIKLTPKEIDEIIIDHLKSMIEGIEKVNDINFIMKNGFSTHNMKGEDGFRISKTESLNRVEIEMEF